MIEYTIRRSDRARRVNVRVGTTGEVEVVLPRRASERAAHAAVAELRPWIERRLAEARRAHAAITARGDAVPYLGSELALRPQPGRRRVRRDGGTLLVPDDETRDASLERWFRRMARLEIEPRLDDACARAGRAYTRLTIRAQRTRWASCSRGGAMSFNWRLLLAPEAVLDYVIWHEVCHLEVMDHSPRFWALLESWLPGYREPAAWLRAHGASLRL